MGMNGAGISGTDTDGALPLHFVSFYFQLTNFISHVPTNQHPYPANRQYSTPKHSEILKLKIRIILELHTSSEPAPPEFINHFNISYLI